LLVGQLEYAAQVALKAGRSTEAFLIAESGGDELYEQIKAEYLAQHKDPFVKEVIGAVAEQDFTGILDQVRSIEQQPGQPLRQLGHCSWKEAIAYVLAYHDDQRLKEVAKTLGDQLLKNKTDINSAIVCYILANELDIVTDLWKKRALYHIRKLGVNKNEALFMLY
jgi:protein transport protein SEC31